MLKDWKKESENHCLVITSSWKREIKFQIVVVQWGQSSAQKSVMHNQRLFLLIYSCKPIVFVAILLAVIVIVA